MLVSVYLVIMIIGAILLFVVMFMGHDFHVEAGGGDIDHGGAGEVGHGPSAFSLPVILSVVTAFGAFGVIFENAGVGVIQVPLLSMVFAVMIGVVTFVAMYKMFTLTESTTRLKYEDLVGMRGAVSIPLKDGGEGQVIFTPPGRGRVQMTAIADDDIEREEVVVALELVGNTMKVKRIGTKKPAEKLRESKYKRPEVK